MANFVIHLIKLGNPTLDEPKVVERLKSLFNQVIAKGKVTAYQQTDVNWRQDCPASIPDDQLLVYVLRNQSDSVVATHFKYKGRLDAGITIWDKDSTGSEVYVSGCPGNGVGVANIIFHESMHNKGHWGDALHRDGGLAAETVYETTELTQKNIDRLAPVLTAKHPPWTGGCDYYNDPLRGTEASNSFFPNRPEALGVAAAGAAVRGGSVVPGPRGLA